jgi:hypothetical protein
MGIMSPDYGLTDYGGGKRRFFPLQESSTRDVSHTHGPSAEDICD